MKNLGITSKARRVLGATALTAAFLVTVAATPASAFSYQNVGRPGGVTTYKTTGNGALTYDSTRVTSGRIIIDRSAASSASQHITIRWRLWQLRGGAWSVVSNASTAYIAHPGQYVDFRGWHYDSVGGTFATDTLITWRTTGGTFLGQQLRDYIHAGDYQCTAGANCTVYYAGGQYVVSIS